MTETIYVYQDANLTKQIRALLKGGANASQAARHAQKIIDQLIEGGVRDPKLMGRLTRNGEARIRNCFKFDLVRGYRLIGVLGNREISFLFVGSHDECDHWIKNNAGLEPVLHKKRNRVAEVSQTAANKTPHEIASGVDCSETDYDMLLFRKITEQDLRKIFCGLCRNGYEPN